jgi:ubiquinone/menaquinone biosynthesis C-methylase UbiE
MDTDRQIETLATYYARRANEYEEIYYRHDLQRQKEQVDIQANMKDVLLGADVLEVACGTGYWTQFVSETANRITATDFNQEVLEIAKHKRYSCPISLEKADAYNLPFESKTFTAGLANFWFSHIPKNRIEYFLNGFHKVLKAGSNVFIADNMNVAGVGGDLIRKQGDDNTYKLRTLKDGTQQEVLKNYFTKEELFQIFKKYDPMLSEDNITIGKCFWYLKYTI